MNKLTLYWSIGSQPGRAVKTILDIGRIPHEAKGINVAKMEHKGEQFLKINPLGLIPAIKDGEFTLAQSSAILAYLCEKHPQINHFHGKDIYQRAIVNQYLSLYQSKFRLAMFRPFRRFLTSSLTQNPINEKQMIILWKQMWKSIEQFNAILVRNKTQFIAGNNPTIADLLYFYQLTNLTYFKTTHLNYSRISSWYKNIYDIPQVNTIMKEWQILAKERAQIFDKIMPIRNHSII